MPSVVATVAEEEALLTEGVGLPMVAAVLPTAALDLAEDDSAASAADMAATEVGVGEAVAGDGVGEVGAGDSDGIPTGGIRTDTIALIGTLPIIPIIHPTAMVILTPTLTTTNTTTGTGIARQALPRNPLITP